MVATLMSVLPLGGYAAEVNFADETLAEAGGTITLNGSGLTGTSKVTFVMHRGDDNELLEAAFTVVNDSTLEVVMPDLSSASELRADLRLLVETPTDRIAQIFPNQIDYTSGDLLPWQTNRHTYVVKSGSVLAIDDAPVGPNGLQAVYVEQGARLELSGFQFRFVVFAAEGAIIDLTEGAPEFLYHSAGTTILGAIPDGTGKLGAPLAPSYGIEPFGIGFPLNVTIIGNGFVSRNPNQPLYRVASTVQITATPGPDLVFGGYSGDASGLNRTTNVEFSIFGGERNVTATFSQGFELDRLFGSGGSVTVQPDKPKYAPGEQVTLTATADVGYSFIGWGIDHLSSTTDNPVTITVGDNMNVSAGFRRDDYGDGPQVSSADLYFVPEGEPFAVSGSGLGDITSATFISAVNPPVDAPIQSVGQGSVSLIGPSWRLPWANSRPSFLLLQGPSAATLQIHDQEDRFFIQEFNVGSIFNGANLPVIKPGAIMDLTEAVFTPFFPLVYVEDGGVIKAQSLFEVTVFAEDGAVVVLEDGTNCTIYHSSGTVLDVPPDTECIEVSPLRPSYGTFAFFNGLPVDVEIVGNGSVTKSPDLRFYKQNSNVTLTAVPDEGATFIGYAGDASGTNPVVSRSVAGTGLSVTANFSVGYVLERYIGSGGTVSFDPDKAIYSPGEIVTVTATPDPGHSFHSWGGALDLATAGPHQITMNGNSVLVAGFRDDGYGSLPMVTSADPTMASVGTPVTISGTGLDNAASAEFLNGPFRWATPIQGSTSTSVDFAFPDIERFGNSQHLLLLQTDDGSAVQIPLGHQEILPGVVNLQESVVWVVKSGTVFESPSIVPVPRSLAIYVEDGAVLKGDLGDRIVFAEDGAILDFTGSAIDNSTVVLSPDTVVLGNSPAGGNNTEVLVVPPIRGSYGIPAFSLGCELNITIDGPGGVTVVPDQPFYAFNTIVELTANPDSEATFIRWSGDLLSRSKTANFFTAEDCNVIARFSDRPEFFTTWRPQHFNEFDLANPAVSGPDGNPDGDPLTNSAEYAFGTDPLKNDGSIYIRFHPDPEDPTRGEIEYRRPIFAADIDYSLNVTTDLLNWITSTDPEAWFSVAETSATPFGTTGNETVIMEIRADVNLPSPIYFTLSAEVVE